MSNWRTWNNCTIFWWAMAALIGVATFYNTHEATSAIAAILLGLAVTAFVGLGMSRLFCVGPTAGVVSDTSFTKPAVGDDTASVAKAAAYAAAHRAPPIEPVVSKSAKKAPAAAPKPAKKAAAPKAEPKPKPKPKAAKPAKAAAPAAKVKAATAATPDYDGDGAHEGSGEGKRPKTLKAARRGKADDLKQIKGIGPKLETLCNKMGFYHFDQIAKWTADEVAWVNANLEGFKGRVTRDDWVAQATILAAGGETEFSKRVEDGDVY